MSLSESKLVLAKPTLFGFWHNKLGADPKLICWGVSETGQASDAIQAFKEAYPKKSLQNLTLTFNRPQAEYIKIATEQLLNK